MLFGFQTIQNSLFDSFKNNKLHHALLFSGNKGIGKAALALELAEKILLDSSINISEDLKKIKSGSHPDLLLIEREMGTKQELKKDISIEQIRKIHEFISLTSATSKHRVIIIDAIDELNKNGANAILKVLEEPPTNVFLFLINHNLGKLPVTIKSRCNLIKINPPSFEDFSKILKSKIITQIKNNELENLFLISGRSIALALEIHSYQGLQLYSDLAEILSKNKIDSEAITLAEKFSGKDFPLVIFENLINFFLGRALKISSNIKIDKYISDQEEQALRWFCAKNNPEKIFALSDKINKSLTEIKNLNLDKRQNIINIFNLLYDTN